MGSRDSQRTHLQIDVWMLPNRPMSRGVPSAGRYQTRSHFLEGKKKRKEDHHARRKKHPTYARYSLNMTKVQEEKDKKKLSSSDGKNSSQWARTTNLPVC